MWRGFVVASVAGLAGCGPKASPARREVPPPPPVAPTQKPIRLDMPVSERERILVEYYRKPVMGRRSSLRDVERIVRDVTPILERAARQPEVAPVLKRLADDLGLGVDAARERWVRLQEADILLESGGDPEDVSSANAVGVAQWIYETGARAGLKVDRAASKTLTAKIDTLKRQVAWMEYLTNPGADPAAPGNPGITMDQARERLPATRAELERLRAKRRAVDQRYDPETALSAHTRYLLGLYRKFPDLQWVFQAFHGGEAGVARTLARYAGPALKGTPAQLIRLGDQGKRLTYQRVYFTSSPFSHPAAFSYLYGRGDDHRHYWWKIRAALEAFALYRKDPAEFQRRWEGILPGRAKEAMWRPDGPKYAYPSWESITDAVSRKELVAVTGTSELRVTPAGKGTMSALRPEGGGLLQLLAATCRASGLKPPLSVGQLIVPANSNGQRPVVSARPGWPPDPLLVKLPGGGPPGDFNYHGTGWAFDIVRPSDAGQRKRLEYAIGSLRDRDLLWFMQEDDAGQPRYHIVPNPAYQQALTQIGAGGPVLRLALAQARPGRISTGPR